MEGDSCEDLIAKEVSRYLIERARHHLPLARWQSLSKPESVQVKAECTGPWLRLAVKFTHGRNGWKEKPGHVKVCDPRGGFPAARIPFYYVPCRSPDNALEEMRRDAVPKKRRVKAFAPGQLGIATGVGISDPKRPRAVRTVRQVPIGIVESLGNLEIGRDFSQMLRMGNSRDDSEIKTTRNVSKVLGTLAA